jgi:uncharacterized protein (DUF305 family)
MSKKNIFISLLVMVLAIGIPVGYQLFTSQNQKSISTSYSNSMMGMDHDSMSMSMVEIKDDQSFLFEMIPHHQEAVDSSQTILKTTKDNELKTFAEKVIVDQNKEITDMKNWYKELAGKEYSTNISYQAMMGGMNGKTGEDLDKAYISGMIMHHQMAINMANSVLKVSKDERVKTLAQNIIKNQQAEIQTLRGWMISKYNDHGMMGM